MRRLYIYILALLALSVSCQSLELPEELPEEDPVPPTVPSGVVSDDPFVENLILPLRSVRYTVIPAAESLVSASDVGCPYLFSAPTQITP
jgi:hypothetical protein